MLQGTIYIVRLQNVEPLRISATPLQLLSIEFIDIKIMQIII